MVSEGILPDRFSFSLVLKACARAVLLREGLQVHGLLVKAGLQFDLFLQNSLMAFYCGCLLLAAARQIFDRMHERDSISCNIIINGYSAAGKMVSARQIFDQTMGKERNTISWNSMICGYARLGLIDSAREIFDEMPERDSFSWNSMIDGLVKSGRVAEAITLFDQMPHKNLLAKTSIIHGHMENGNADLAHSIFDEMPQKDLVAWNIMISGYVSNGFFREALSLFQDMPEKSGLLPDDVTLASVLSAIAELGQIKEGLLIHEYIKRNKLSLSGKLGVALVDMYSKCGRLEEALKTFEISGFRTVDHWNSMIGGLAIHGKGRLALKLFEDMKRHSIQPDDITFIEILKACSHSGLVEEGLEFFSAMETEYKIDPKIQHYGCLVDILARSGRIEDARRLIEAMPMSPNDVVLRSLLSACKNHGKFELGEITGKILLRNRVRDPSSYVLLSNLYSRRKMWRDSRKIRADMETMELRKLPGCSWIELDDSIHEFTVGS